MNSPKSVKRISLQFKDNPKYGKIICRCEKITEGEIIDAINGRNKIKISIIILLIYLF